MGERRILVVDDEPHIRKIIGDVLRKNDGYDVSTAYDGRDALERLEAMDFAVDLVLSDMMMPRMDGLTFIRELRLRAPEMAVIVLTAHKNDENVIECLRLGAFGYLLKPISVKKLQQEVRRAFERRDRFGGARDAIDVEAGPSGWVELTAPTDFEYVERFDRFTSLIGNAPIPEEDREAIRVAVNEIGQNAVEWGNRQDREKRIHLSYCLFSDRLVLKIRDEGPGFDPETLGDPSADPLRHIAERMDSGKRAGGYGVFMTRRLMDEVIYNERGNVVLLTKYFNAGVSPRTDASGDGND